MQPMLNEAHTQPLLARVNWRCESLRAAKELSNREIHAPAVSAYRWWARRPHNVMGALLDAAVAQYGSHLTVSDPFSGGGTVTFEASRRGLKAYAQDLYPWPARGLAAALSPCNLSELEDAAREVLKTLEPMRAAYRNDRDVELTHILRVRVSDCLNCGRPVFEFPHTLVSVSSRRQDDQNAYFGCRHCGHLTSRKRTVSSFTCEGCGSRILFDKALNGCPGCKHRVLKPRTWWPVLVQELTSNRGQLKAVLRLPLPGDPTGHAEAGIPSILLPTIPAGQETKRLLDNGFKTWGDLYTHRQMDVLQKGIAAISSLNCKAAIKERLAFSLLGAAEMPAFLCRWDRFNLKPFEGMANHRFTQTTLAVEANLLSPVGRGTLPRRLEAASNTLVWLMESGEKLPKVIGITSGRRGRKISDWDVLIATGSSVKQELRNATVDVVITDPPYFSDVQYGELAGLFHAWLEVYDPTIVVDKQAEAVPNSARGTSAEDYRGIIAACLKESRRTLTKDGRLVLTFHNKKVVAWRALCGAIADAGFRVHALAVVLAENGTDHCKRNVNAMLHDLVIECVPANGSKDLVPFLAFEPVSVEEKNLAAVGLALAQCAQRQDPNSLRSAYIEQLARLGASRRLIE